MLKPGSPGDPVKGFGEAAAAYLVSSLGSLPPAQRFPAIKALFDQLDPALYPRVRERLTKYEKKGLPRQAAFRKAIASSMSQGLVEEFMKLGRGQRPQMKSLGGLRVYGAPARHAIAMGAYEALGFSIGGAIKDIGGGIKDGVNKVGGAIKDGASGAWDWTKGAAGDAWDWTKGAASDAWDWTKDAVGKIDDLVCKVANSSLGSSAIQAGGGALGGPQGAKAAQAGTSIARGACGGGGQPAMPPPPPPKPPMPPWVLPAAIGGGVLLLVLVVR